MTYSMLSNYCASQLEKHETRIKKAYPDQSLVNTLANQLMQSILESFETLTPRYSYTEPINIKSKFCIIKSLLEHFVDLVNLRINASEYVKKLRIHSLSRQVTLLKHHRNNLKFSLNSDFPFFDDDLNLQNIEKELSTLTLQNEKLKPFSVGEKFKMAKTISKTKTPIIDLAHSLYALSNAYSHGDFDTIITANNYDPNFAFSEYKIDNFLAVIVSNSLIMWATIKGLDNISKKKDRLSKASDLKHSLLDISFNS